MFNLNSCFKCTYRCKLPKILPQSILQIEQINRTMNPLWSKLMDQAIDQKYPNHE